jgi:hypothetical protein
MIDLQQFLTRCERCGFDILVLPDKVHFCWAKKDFQILDNYVLQKNNSIPKDKADE